MKIGKSTPTLSIPTPYTTPTPSTPTLSITSQCTIIGVRKVVCAHSSAPTSQRHPKHRQGISWTSSGNPTSDKEGSKGGAIREKLWEANLPCVCVCVCVCSRGGLRTPSCTEASMRSEIAFPGCFQRLSELFYPPLPRRTEGCLSGHSAIMTPYRETLSLPCDTFWEKPRCPQDRSIAFIKVWVSHTPRLSASRVP